MNEGNCHSPCPLFHVAVLGPGAGHAVQVEARRPASKALLTKRYRISSGQKGLAAPAPRASWGPP